MARRLIPGTIHDVGQLRSHFAGWSGAGVDGYHLDDYFDANGRYRGPDESGVEPLFVIDRPTVRLTGRDGNAFAIISSCQKAAQHAGWPAERIKTVISEMIASDYDHLLRKATEHFDVE